MRRVLKVAVLAVVALVPAVALASLVAVYALWWQAATPVWHQGQLTEAALQRPVLQVVDQSIRKATQLGLMQLPTMAPGLRYDTLTELWWSNGDVTVVLSVGPLTLLDDRGLPYFHPHQFLPPLKPARLVSVPGNFTLLSLARNGDTLVMTQLIRWPHGSTLTHQPGVSVAGIVVLAIGDMNKGSVGSAPQQPNPGPRTPNRNEGLLADRHPVSHFF